MWADFEPLTSVLRVFADNARWGDPYEWSATIKYIDRSTIEIMGIIRAPKPSEWRSIIKACKALNIETIEFERKKGGKTTKKRLVVKKRLDI